MFYRLSNDEGRRTRYTSAFTLGLFEKPIGLCLKCGKEIERSNNSYEKNIMVLLKENYADFIPYYVSFKIVSARFKEIAEKESLSGLTFRKAEIKSATDLTPEDIIELRTDAVPLKNVVVNPPEYYKLDIEQGAIYHENSKLMVNTSCDVCGIKTYSTEGNEWVMINEEYPVVLDVKSLKGYDLFHAEGYGTTNFCSRRFYKVYQQYKLTGLLFEPIEVI